MATQTRPPINPSPKWRFMQSEQNISKHRQLVDSPEFDRAIDFAQMQYIRGLVETAPQDISGTTYMAVSASLFQRVVGMQEFVKVLRHLAETPPPMTPKANDNLS
jgi:hypothetical protein